MGKNVSNKTWIGHDIKEFVESQLKKSESAVIELKDGNKYLLFTNVLDKLNYQYATKPIPYGTRFEITRGKKQNA